MSVFLSIIKPSFGFAAPFVSVAMELPAPRPRPLPPHAALHGCVPFRSSLLPSALGRVTCAVTDAALRRVAVATTASSSRVQRRGRGEQVIGEGVCCSGMLLCVSSVCVQPCECVRFVGVVICTHTKYHPVHKMYININTHRQTHTATKVQMR